MNFWYFFPQFILSGATNKGPWVANGYGGRSGRAFGWSCIPHVSPNITWWNVRYWSTLCFWILLCPHFLILSCVCVFHGRSVSFEFQHNVCGRSIYAEGTVDAILFLAKKVITFLKYNYLVTGVWCICYQVKTSNIWKTVLPTTFQKIMSRSLGYHCDLGTNNNSFHSLRLCNLIKYLWEMQVKSNADKRIYNMIDVLSEGNMR